MGNCIRHESPMQWAGDDWGSPGGDPFFSSESPLQNKGCAIGTEEKIRSSSSSSTVKEVKIKITKKQLQEILSRVDLKELSVQQVLAQLVNVGDDKYESHRRSWRPALQSIPEVN
ncbi:hypothetical protein SLEP1_g50026 [Rubroshorea leprosula]|uniref:Uncharacterized protein n=1 Tax=Rubroshorea leprosula TaxID=152421 RepID=A0AAV5LYP8_9ROSI|nr:hypothetical protein SLEP1_g50026 [Rubroshorea leprosula]